MLRRIPPVALALVLLLTLAACTSPVELLHVLAAPSATPEPRVVIVVATPTPAAPPPLAAETTASASLDASGLDAVETRRIAIYERVAPAVVNVTTQVLRSDFFWGSTQEEGSGSGFLWDDQGHIVTNYHVVEGAQQIEVGFGGDVTYPAEVVGSDPLNDLAVLKVEQTPAGVAPLEMGSSADLKVGQTAIAIGNPFGQFERTMTQGIIGAVNRTIDTDTTVLRGVIQTDAAINRGNSGGPLLDSRGQLIGVNSAIYSPTGTSAGVGLAIPVDKVRRVVPELIESGRYPHPWLGIENLGYEISPALAQGLDLPVESGLLIARLYNGSPADRAGVRGATDEVILGNRRYLIGGDILTSVDGKPVAKWEDLNGYLDEQTRVDQTITLTMRRGAEDVTLRATLEDTPRSMQGQ
jgi:S1-C subfamily serine protease